MTVTPSHSEGIALDVEWLEEMLLKWVEWAANMPVLSYAVNYIATSLHHDPWRLFLEVFMVGVLLRFLFGKRYRPKENLVKLTRKEVDELVSEWTPEPLVPAFSDRVKRENESIRVIEGRVGPVVKVGTEDKVNMASYNFLGFVGEERIEKVAERTLRNYGVGSCGPPGFYGTIDVHMNLEHKIAEIMGTEEAILYSYAFATIASTIPAFAKRGDLLICDEAIGFPIQKGVLVSRATVMYFKHNDMEDLERILTTIKQKDAKEKKRLTRRFIVTEGIFQNNGDIAPLPKLIELKNRYKYRLIIDESFSFGILGKTGKGICEHYNIKSSDVDILTGSLSTSFASAGGYCTGSTAVADHQRLSGAGYCFSASMPAMLAASGVEALTILQAEPQRIQKLRENILAFRKGLVGNRLIDVQGAEFSPIIFIGLKNHLPSRDREEDILQGIVDEAFAQGFLFTRAKYVEEEVKLPPPSIRVSISSAHTPDQIKKAVTVLDAAILKFASAIEAQ